MKKTILTIMMFLLRKITVISYVFLSLCYCSCAQLISSEFQPNPIIGKWKLVRTETGRPKSITHCRVEIILEFKQDNTLTVQCPRQDSCHTWDAGDYRYLRLDSTYETKIQIDNKSWWYSISEKKLMIGQGPIDGLSYFFEKM